MATTTDDMSILARSSGDTAPAWRTVLPALVAVLAALVALFWDTAASIVDIWWRSETFAHGFVIAPITLWLVWRERAALARLTPRPGLAPVPLILMIVLAWLLARLAGVLVGEQLAFVTLIPLAVWAVLGWSVVSALLFPLAFLFFMVPMGEALIPPLMDFTAAFTVHMLQLTGIPVYWEGTFFTIPSGQWSVVEGCSGVRYLIASITLGTLYAYLTYQRYWKRALFIALSVVVPVFANGMRAYIIVMIAHLSDMKLAHGIDHFIYGWVWFGVVMMILFWLGSFWRDDAETVAGQASHAKPVAPGSRPAADAALQADTFAVPTARTGVVALATVLAAGLGPAASAYLAHAEATAGAVPLAEPAGSGGWVPVGERLSDWEPRYLGMDAFVHRTYREEGRAVGVFVAYYGGLQQGGELVNSQNILIPQKHPNWRMTVERPQTVRLGDREATVNEAILRSSERDFLVWRWNWFGGDITMNPYLGKLFEIRDRLLEGHRGSAGVVLYTPFSDNPEDERKLLQGFVDAMLPSVAASLEAARAR